MKRFIALCIFVVLTACNSQKKYTDFDYSYSRSGGVQPMYENLLIKGRNAHYSYEGQGKKVKKDFKLTPEDLQKIETVLKQNNFRMIQEDYKKLYDHIATSINVKKGSESASKSDASLIMVKDQQRWDNVVSVFRQITDANINQNSAK